MENIHTLVAEDRLAEALNQLQELLPEHQKQEVIILKGQLTKLEKGERLGTLGPSDINTEHARIQKAILSLAGSIPKSQMVTSGQLGDAPKGKNATHAHETYEEIINGVAFTMVAIPGGNFTMGATPEQLDAEDHEKPPHKVTLSAYFLAETLVTQALWQAVMGGNPSHFKGASDLPVEFVSWEDARLFIQKLNALKKPSGPTYRLPTEAEWEYAAREGGRAVLFGNGKMIANPSQMNFNASKKYKTGYSVEGVHREKTTAVKTFAPNALGLYDMSGNLLEWCQDWFEAGYYANSPVENPHGPNTGSHRVFRGGSWFSHPQGCRVARRGNFALGGRNNFVGFRLASQ